MTDKRPKETVTIDEEKQFRHSFIIAFTSIHVALKHVCIFCILDEPPLRGHRPFVQGWLLDRGSTVFPTKQSNCLRCFPSRRNKPTNFHYSFQQRAVMTRKDSEESILQRDMSVKDICRSEKHYLNVVYDENCDVSDDEGFMVQVDLKPKNKKSATVSHYIKQKTKFEC